MPTLRRDAGDDRRRVRAGLRARRSVGLVSDPAVATVLVQGVVAIVGAVAEDRVVTGRRPPGTVAARIREVAAPWLTFDEIATAAGASRKYVRYVLGITGGHGGRRGGAGRRRKR